MFAATFLNTARRALQGITPTLRLRKWNGRWNWVASYEGQRGFNLGKSRQNKKERRTVNPPSLCKLLKHKGKVGSGGRLELPTLGL